MQEASRASDAAERKRDANAQRQAKHDLKNKNFFFTPRHVKSYMSIPSVLDCPFLSRESRLLETLPELGLPDSIVPLPFLFGLSILASLPLLQARNAMLYPVEFLVIVSPPTGIKLDNTVVVDGQSVEVMVVVDGDAPAPVERPTDVMV
jgi:hypothetical protein